MRKLLLTVWAVVCTQAMAQSSAPCYFGECDARPPAQRVEAPPATPQPAPPATPPAAPPAAPPVTPAPPAKPEAPSPTVSTAPVPRLGARRGMLDVGVPEFFRQNLCFAGNVAVPAKDAQTCALWYRPAHAAPSGGSRIACGILKRESGLHLSFKTVQTHTVGECFAQRDANHVALSTHGLCQRKFARGYFHWRFDLSQQECSGVDVGKQKAH